MTTLANLELPTTASATDRIYWAGERIADLADGAIDSATGWLVWNVVVGWTDLCSEDERRQYRALALQIATLCG
jgi:hypothetical protein